MAWDKRFFERRVSHLLRRVRHSLASQSGITRAVRATDLTRKFTKIEHLSLFHKVLGTHNTAEAIFLRRTSELSLLLLRENHVPVIPISFRNRFLAFAPIIAGGEATASSPRSALDGSAPEVLFFSGGGALFSRAELALMFLSSLAIIFS